LENKEVLKICTYTYALKFSQVYFFIHFLNQSKLNQFTITEH
jgi:hypothetical protein